MTKIIGVWNIKGGEGKTTTSINLAVGLAHKKKKVLVVDLDPQANLSSSLIREEKKENDYKCMTDLFVPVREIKTQECIYKSSYGVDVIGSNLALTNGEMIVRSNPVISQNTVLINILNEVKDNYDFIIIDCPPSLNLLTINMAMCSDVVITTISSDEWAYDGYEATKDNIKIINENFNANIKQKILFTKVTNTKVDRDSIIAIQNNTDLSLKTKIRNQSAILKRGGEWKIVVNLKEKYKKEALKIMLATEEKKGYIKGTLILKRGCETSEVKINKVIEKNSKEDKNKKNGISIPVIKDIPKSDKEKVNEAKRLIEFVLANMVVTNDTTVDNVIEIITSTISKLEGVSFGFLVEDVGTDYRNLVKEILYLCDKGEL